MHAVITEKSPGGKLVRIKADFDIRLKALQISGDFFLHPEEAIEALERSLLGTSAAISEAALAERIDSFLRSQAAEFLGLTPQTLAHAIHLALNTKGATP
ncbi:MAG TPA: biotin--protein ligase [archaeon]|nr:biotin--protein ligase [archaeon]